MFINRLGRSAVEDQALEIVERKGLGHPDTICDSVMNRISIELSKEYIKRFGVVLHHNVDKALLCGGAALAMAEWELTVQYPEGGFPGHFVDRPNPPVVFNTGQVIFGLLAAHEAAGNAYFLASARQAGDWLLGEQDPDGSRHLQRAREYGRQHPGIGIEECLRQTAK